MKDCSNEGIACTCRCAASALAQMWLTCASQPATRRRPVAMVLAAPAVCALGCGVLRAQHHPRLHCGCAAQPSRDVRRPVQRARAFPLRQPGRPVAGGLFNMQPMWPVGAPHCEPRLRRHKWCWCGPLKQNFEKRAKRPLGNAHVVAVAKF